MNRTDYMLGLRVEMEGLTTDNPPEGYFWHTQLWSRKKNKRDFDPDMVRINEDDSLPDKTWNVSIIYNGYPHIIKELKEDQLKLLTDDYSLLGWRTDAKPK